MDSPLIAVALPPLLIVLACTIRVGLLRAQFWHHYRAYGSQGNDGVLPGDYLPPTYCAATTCLSTRGSALSAARWTRFSAP